VPTRAFTIAKLADAAGVGVETVRYYQRRGLMGQPQREGGGFHEYTPADVQRLQFIRRALDLGFGLDDIAELVSLSGERDKLRVREITQRRLAEIQQRVEQLQAMASAMSGLVDCCKRSASNDCPIIGALANESFKTDMSARTPAAAKPRQRRGPAAGSLARGTGA
jgi:MerR family mercuric resistance operon transcriptional regulator